MNGGGGWEGRGKKFPLVFSCGMVSILQQAYHKLRLVLSNSLCKTLHNKVMDTLHLKQLRVLSNNARLQ